ncbi:aminoglycoside phosphotransferase family protein [Streptomyces sp. NPDC060194]|uniref:aminoglycoside phosphotransferase family protein n=1 Tax=Streptomyces sp. NPDC060194 TaxID=3347069 RepID=UPI003665A3FA
MDPTPKPVAPPATGLRRDWGELPADTRAATEALLGAEVVTATTQNGGFSPGIAVRVRLADGRRAFVKAIGRDPNPHSPHLHLAEARNAAALPGSAPAPRLLGWFDDGAWVVLAFEDVDGRMPEVPWREGELRRLLDALTDLAADLTPAPFPAARVEERAGPMFEGWRRLLEAGGDDRLDPWAARHLPALAELAAAWPAHLHGETLAHGDIRADNVLLTPDRVVFVDWPHAMRTTPWFDLLVALPCIAAQGGPDPEETFTTHPLGRAADPAAVTCVLAALTGYFVCSGLQPDPPGLPTLRPFQRAQGAAALAWLRRRSGPLLR